MNNPFNPAIFRESDIRGIVGQDLNSRTVEGIARAAGTYVRKHGGRTIVLGWDIRPSSFEYKQIATRALLDTGCDVLEIGCVPTPLCYFAQFHLKTDGGFMITASHNPSEFNGFKISLGNECLFGNAIQELRQMVELGDFATGKGQWRTQDVLEAYVEFIRSRIQLPRKVKVGIDGGNGCYGIIGPRLLEALDLEPVHLYLEPDGTFPNHHPDPTIENNLEDLRKQVLSGGLEVGIGFDGDMDRIGVLDEKGEVVWGDQLLILFAREILEQHPGASIIGEVKCSRTLFDDVQKRGGKPIMSPAGHSLIKNKMKETGALLAGEMSGHFFFADDYPGYDDALYTACRLLQILAYSEQPLSHFMQDVPQTAATPEIRLDCPDEIKFQLVEEIHQQFKSTHEICHIDGIRIDFKNGWALIRASNTQPALTLRFEADTEKELKVIQDRVMIPLNELSSQKGLHL